MASIQFSPFTAIFENKSSGTAIFGAPGSGKTFFLLNLIANAIMMNQRVFAIDPKNDLGVISDIFSSVEYIDINNIQPGALNPFTVLKNVDTNVISSIISIICGGLSDDQLIAITPILNDFVNQYKRDKKSGKVKSINFSNVADYLFANDNMYAQAIGTKLNIHKDSKYGPLLFEEETEKSGHVSLSNRSKIISLHGMDLPNANDNSNTMTEEQKFNSGIIFIICKMLRDLLTTGGYPTMFVLDEAHIAFKNPSFSSIVDEFLVLGRSLNVPTILATQNPTHFPESISQLISSKFCFKCSTSEANAFLNNFFNKDGVNSADFESIVYQIGQFESGQCYFIDSSNRSGIFKVTSLLGDISSNPLTRKKK